MPSDTIVVGDVNALSYAGGIKRIAEVGIAFSLLVEVGTRPSVAVIAGDHNTLPKHGCEHLSVVAVDAKDIAVQAAVARLPRSPVIKGTVNAAPIGGDKYGFVVVRHEIGISHITRKNTCDVFALGAFSTGTRSTSLCSDPF